MRARFEGSEHLLQLVEDWDARGRDAGQLPAEVDRGLADRETRLDLERLTVMIPSERQTSRLIVVR
jgi:hypothetical protein